jgi:general secretion pathway protein G
MNADGGWPMADRGACADTRHPQSAIWMGDQMKVRAKKAGGFTLIELLLVVVIIGILAAIVVPRLVGRTEDANIAKAKADLGVFRTQLYAYEVDNGSFPTSEQGLRALIEKPSGDPEPKKWRRLLDSSDVPGDPWGNEYVYKCPGEKNQDGFDLFSIGKDGSPGTDDDIDLADVKKE